jgi:hypothetical protein
MLSSLKTGIAYQPTFKDEVLTYNSLSRLSKRMAEMKSGGEEDSAEPVITFDKDDDDTLDFVTAGANLRSIVFGIETKSRFDIKQMAGNIIPAIATTNAIVAGLCVLQSYKVLRGEFSSTKEVSLDFFMTLTITNLLFRFSCHLSPKNDSLLLIDFENQTPIVQYAALHRHEFL